LIHNGLPRSYFPTTATTATTSIVTFVVATIATVAIDAQITTAATASAVGAIAAVAASVHHNLFSAATVQHIHVFTQHFQRHPIVMQDRSKLQSCKRRGQLPQQLPQQIPQQLPQ
jgi:hypothetical protein